MQQEPLRLLLEKLERRHPLPARERDALVGLPGERRDYPPGASVIARGQLATHCVVIASGLLSRQKALPDGRRQLLALHLPGDAIDLQSLFFVLADHDIKTHTPVQTLWVRYVYILEACEKYPLLANALWADCLVDSAIFREWTTNIGQRGARERLAHFFCELASRYEAIGLLREDSFEVALNQQEIADAVGLSLVHTNKSLRSLREADLLHIGGRTVTLLNRRALETLAMFSPAYLHRDGKTMTDPAAHVPAG